METIIYIALQKVNEGLSEEFSVKTDAIWDEKIQLIFLDISKEFLYKDIKIPEEKKNKFYRFLLKIGNCVLTKNYKEKKKEKDKERNLIRMMEYKSLAIAKKIEDIVPAQKGVVYLLYDRSFKKWVNTSEYLLFWEKVRPYPMFEEYTEYHYVKKLIEFGRLSNYIILGYERCLEEILPEIARHLKSVRFILEYLPRNLENLLVNIYEEYGLLVQVNVIPGEVSSSDISYQLHCSEPSVILDFTRTEIINLKGVAKGSIWLDVNASDKKEVMCLNSELELKYVSINSLLRERHSNG